MGHVLGLLHTHQQDVCSDTRPDHNSEKYGTDCYPGISCNALCNCDQNSVCENPPTKNVMSYYNCRNTASRENFSPCQVNMARCFTDKMFIHPNDKETPGTGNKKSCSYSTNSNNQGILFLLAFLSLTTLFRKKRYKN